MPYTCSICKIVHQTNELCPIRSPKFEDNHVYNIKNICLECGCSKECIEYFKWRCKNECR
jgi:hypothetical protein